MIHSDEIHEELLHQCEVIASATIPDDEVFRSYLRNLGICLDCLTITAIFWCEDLADITVTAPIAFSRGVSIGLILGRKHPV